MAYLVRLKKDQRKLRNVTTPLLKDAEKLSLDEINSRVDAYLNDRTDSNKEQAVSAFYSMLRFIIGRYLAHWPTARKYEDDLASVGVLRIITLLNDWLQPGDNHAMIATVKVQDALNEYITLNDSCLTVSIRTLWNTRDLQVAADISNVDPNEFAVVADDTMAVDLIDEQCGSGLSPLAEWLLRDNNFYKCPEDVSRECEVSVRTVRRAKAEVKLFFERFFNEEDC